MKVRMLDKFIQSVRSLFESEDKDILEKRKQGYKTVEEIRVPEDLPYGVYLVKGEGRGMEILTIDGQDTGFYVIN